MTRPSVSPVPGLAVRGARTTDAAALAGLARELGYPASDGEMAARIDALDGDADQVVLVAECEGAVVGWIHVGTTRSLESDPFVEIRGLVVTESMRGRGIGGALVDEAEAWARRAGVTRMRVRSREAREGAHRFYERRGYETVKTQRVFDKRLDGA